MVSMIDALFILPAAFFAVGFIVPALILSTDSATEFRQVTSLGMSDTVAQSMTSAFLNTEKDNGLTNYKAASYVMSGNATTLKRPLFSEYPQMFQYLRFSFDSPYDNQPGDIPGDIDSVSDPTNLQSTLSSLDLDDLNYDPICFRIPRALSAKEGAVLDGSCDYAYTIRGGDSPGREKNYFRTKIPVRGGERGDLVVSYEVK